MVREDLQFTIENHQILNQSRKIFQIYNIVCDLFFFVVIFIMWIENTGHRYLNKLKICCLSLNISEVFWGRGRSSNLTN